MLACFLDPRKFTVTVYEQNTAPGRKFLVAGDGGLNLTHSEDPAQFIERYTPAEFLRKPFRNFNNHDLITWLSSIGIKTYNGSSGRVFPEKSVKPIQVLNAILDEVKKHRVNLLTRYTWRGFDNDNTLLFEQNDKIHKIKSDITVFALGGASWPVTGSTGLWLEYLQKNGINVLPFEASNCAFRINWKKSLAEKIEGKPLKNIVISCENKQQTGEVVLTRFGIEGSGIYPLSPQIKKELKLSGNARIHIDLKPVWSHAEILGKITHKKPQGSYSDHLKKQLNLSPVQLLLLKEQVDKNDFMDSSKLTSFIKALPLDISGTGPLSDAISSTGGLPLDEINEEFMLKKMPGYYVIGEMLDYDAPTGGYLLQSCFSMGHYVAGILNKL